MSHTSHASSIPRPNAANIATWISHNSSPIIFDSFLINRERQLQKWIAEKEKALEDVPVGMLHGIRHGNKFQYFYRLNKGEKKGVYIKGQDLPFIHRLGQKRYDALVLRAARTELARIKQSVGFYEKSRIILPGSSTSAVAENKSHADIASTTSADARFVDTIAADTISPQPLNLTPEQVYEKLPDWLQAVVTPIVEPIGPKVERWLKQTYVGRPFAPDDKTQFYTPSGVRVRSKSEMNISKDLTLFGIPYLYELPLMLANGKMVYPDFSTIDVRTGRIVYWEHLGMLDSETYRDEMMYKANGFAELGIFLGVNLIITYETGRYGLNSRIVRERIWQYYGK